MYGWHDDLDSTVDDAARNYSDSYAGRNTAMMEMPWTTSYPLMPISTFRPCLCYGWFEPLTVG